MASLTDYLEERLLKHSVGLASFTMPATTYLAIHTGDPGETGSSSEASGGSYARVAVSWTWNGGSVRVENSAAVLFASMPAGTFTHWSLKDALTSGNTLFKGALTVPATLLLGDPLNIPAASLKITAD